MSTTKKTYEYLKNKQGDELGVSDWILIDQSMIDQFATLTEDRQFIHVDPLRAKRETAFGGTIAHGFLVLSLASKFASDVFHRESEKSVSINYGFDKIRFITPVTANSFVRGRFYLKRVDSKSSTELRQVYYLSIEIKGSDRLAVVADWITLTIFQD